MMLGVHNSHVITLANSIIGVSILAMPYCFKQCGIILAIIMLLLSNLVSRLSCHFLIKSAIIARRRTFEYLAYHIFGGMGKFTIEVGMIGFLIGSCVAFFVVIGDLGPELISEISGQTTTSTTRITVMFILAMLCVLPLALLKNIDSLTGVSRATIGFYFCLVFKIFIDALPHIFSGDWFSKVDFWKPAGILQCLPILSMALSCQTQLLEIYQVVHNPTQENMNHVIKNAVNICTIVYLFVGFFGYIAFAGHITTGNILLNFSPSVLTNIIKLGFILSIAFSFPLVIFPCRVSVHSLMYRQGISMHEGVNDYIPEGRFQVLTFFIVLFPLIIGILIPNIESVLGLVGSSIGIFVCVLFPVACFIFISQKENNEKLIAKTMLVVGLSLMILGTFENLNQMEKKQTFTVTSAHPESILVKHITVPASVFAENKKLLDSMKITNTVKYLKNNPDLIISAKVTISPEVRHEPPQPVESQDSEIDNKKEAKQVEQSKIELKNVAENNIMHKNEDTAKTRVETQKKVVNDKDVESALEAKVEQIKLENQLKPLGPMKNNEVDIEAIKKDEKEILLADKQTHLEEHRILIDQIQKQNEVQEEIVKQQKKILEVMEKQQEQKVKDEKLKAGIEAVKEIESIALKAIEKLSGDKEQDKEIVAELKKDVEERVIAQEIVKDTEESHTDNKKKDDKLEDLRKMNNLLSAKIKQQDVTQKSLNNIETKISKEKLNITSSGNKTANSSFKQLPLPIAVQLQQKLPTNNSNTYVDKTRDKINNSEETLKNHEEDSKALRRDILEYNN